MTGSFSDVELRVVRAAGASKSVDIRSATDRRIRAEVIRSMMCGEIKGLKAHVIHLENADIQGTLDLDFTESSVPLELVTCRFSDGAVVSLNGAKLKRLSLDGCEIGSEDRPAAPLLARSSNRICASVDPQTGHFGRRQRARVASSRFRALALAAVSTCATRTFAMNPGLLSERTVWSWRRT